MEKETTVYIISGEKRVFHSFTSLDFYNDCKRKEGRKKGRNKNMDSTMSNWVLMNNLVNFSKGNVLICYKNYKKKYLLYTIFQTF